MNLSDFFASVAYKKLVRVDLPENGSNQHELNGVQGLKDFFGTEASTRGKLFAHYFSDDHDPSQQESDFTFYDARAKSAERTGRSEWRFYYYGDFLARAGVGDLFVLAKTRNDVIHALVFQTGSSWERAAQELFDTREFGTVFDAISHDALDQKRVAFLEQQILEELNIGVSSPVAPTDEEIMLQKFGGSFPRTNEMSRFARTQVDVDVRHSDEALTRWLEREEQLFRALEKVIIRERLVRNFATVDEFIEYSLSVQNRRKSRMGFALQNHLVELFTFHQLRFTAQARTEGDNKPDFIFPGEQEYRDPKFDSSLLVMLGVKSTSKDRWRQVLVEADRIPQKHLCTLEAGISTKQTDEMQRQQLKLVVPISIQATYTASQRMVLLSVQEFIDFVARKQSQPE